MQRTLIVIFLLVVLRVLPNDSTCFSRENCDLRIGSVCYVHIDIDTDWFKAEDCCVEWGGHLASIHSASVDNLLNSIRLKIRQTWFGLSDAFMNQTFVWSDGTPYDYNNFLPPNPTMNNEYCCLYYDTIRGETWNDAFCDLANFNTSFICQRNAPPDIPQSITTESITSKIIRVGWDPPLSIDGNGTLILYNISYTGQLLNTTTQYVNINITTVMSPSSVFVNITGLEEYTNYTISVSATNEVGASEFSPGIVQLTNIAAPDAPPQDIVATNINTTTVEICFYPPPIINQNGPINSFNISYQGLILDTAPKYSIMSIDVVYPLGGLLCYTLTVLQDNNYTITVLAINGAGDGPGSIPIIHQTHQSAPPDTPQNITTESITSSIIRVGWDPPLGYDALILYNISYTGQLLNTTTQYVNINITTVMSPSSVFVNITGLEEYTNYTISVSAINEVGASEFSPGIVQLTNIAAPDASPLNVFTTNTNTTTIKICFYPPPTINQNGPINSFNISYHGLLLDTAPKFTLLSIDVVYPLEGQLCDTLTVPQEDNNYTITVRANNVAGTGPGSIPIIHQMHQSVSHQIEGIELVTDEIAVNFAQIITDTVINVNIDPQNITETRESLNTVSNDFGSLVVKYISNNDVDETKFVVVQILLITAQILLQKDIQISATEQNMGESQNSVASASQALRNTLNTVEYLALSLALSSNSTISISTNTFTLIVQNIILQSNQSIINIRIPDENIDVNIGESILIPYEVALELSLDKRNLRIALTVFKNDFNKSKSDMIDSTELFSNIVSLVVASQGEKIQRNNLAKPIQFRFPVPTKEREDINQICSFLDELYWSSEGLRTEEMGNITNCYTNHLTSFAVFVTPRELGGGEELRRIASSVSYVIASISLIALIASLIIFMISYKKFFKKEANIVYFNYCLSLTFAFALYLFGIETSRFDEIVCEVIAFLLHYIWLSVFTWTLCNGIFILYKLTIGVWNQRKIFIYLILFGWLFPSIIPIITIAIRHENYVHNKHCFLTYEDGTIWAFIGPLIAILFINIIILIISVIRVSTAKAGSKKLDEGHIIINALISGLILTPILGIPWIVLLLNVFIQEIIVEWSFLMTNGLMGVFYFFAVTARNEEVRETLRKIHNTCTMINKKTMSPHDKTCHENCSHSITTNKTDTLNSRKSQLDNVSIKPSYDNNLPKSLPRAKKPANTLERKMKSEKDDVIFINMAQSDISIPAKNGDPQNNIEVSDNLRELEEMESKV